MLPTTQEEQDLLRKDLMRTPTRVVMLLAKYQFEALSWRDVALLAAAGCVIQYLL